MDYFEIAKMVVANDAARYLAQDRPTLTFDEADQLSRAKDDVIQRQADVIETLRQIVTKQGELIETLKQTRQA